MIKKKKCKYCKCEFDQFRSTMVVCSLECAIDYAKKKKEDKQKREWRKEKKKIKESLKTKSYHEKELQVIFNRWIRKRDEGKLCISCQKHPKKKNAGHYRSVGSSPELRFEELNVHLQCEYCNTYLHGNLINYRKNLIKKIGIGNVNWLELEHRPIKYSIPEIKEMKKYYKRKLKE